MIDESANLNELLDNISKVFVKENFIFVEDEDKLFSTKYSLYYL